MAIEDLTPFGTAPKFYEGLLGPEETAALQKRAQVQGLLGAGLALAQGMSRGGAPRSALQNILGAAVGGFQGAGGAYQQGLQNFQTQQQIQQAQIQREQLKLQRDQQIAQAEAVKQLLQDPTIANDPAAVAYIRANPVEAVKEISQRRMREGELAKLRQNRTGGVTPTGSMTAEIDAQIQSLRDNAQIAASQGKADQASQYITAANNLTKEKQNIAAANFDFAGLKESVPESLRGNVDFLAKQARDGVIGGDKVFEGIQSIQTAARESAKGNLLTNEKARDYALTQFNTADITKLTQPQRDNALRYAEAPSDADRAKIFNDGLKLKFETGQEPLVPVTRSSMLGRNQPPPVVAPAPAAPAAVTAPAPAPAPSPRAAPAFAAPAPAAPAAPRPRTTPALPTTATAFGLPANANLNSVPIIQQPDSLVPPVTKQKLLLEKPAFQASIDYTLRQVVDARDAAKRLLAEPKYVKSISSATGPAMAYAWGSDAYKADSLLENIKGRSFVATLQEMRANSKTGGAVGSVAVSEMNTLSNIQASLKAGLGEEEFKKQLQQFIDTADRSIKSLPNDYKQTYGYAGEFEDVIKNRVIAPSGAPRSAVRLSNPEAQEVFELYRNQRR
jgi:hypothetical protein